MLKKLFSMLNFSINYKVIIDFLLSLSKSSVVLKFNVCYFI